MLFNEPKLLKFDLSDNLRRAVDCFSALQRAEIAEMHRPALDLQRRNRFSALQRAEIAEIAVPHPPPDADRVFQCSSTSRNC